MMFSTIPPYQNDKEMKKYNAFKTGLEDIFSSEERINEIAHNITKDYKYIPNKNLPDQDIEIEVSLITIQLLEDVIANTTRMFSKKYKKLLSKSIIQKVMDDSLQNHNIFNCIKKNIIPIDFSNKKIE